jgi:multiple sugar transport system permease protein
VPNGVPGVVLVLKRQLSSRREAYLFASPALFLIVAFVVLPLLYSLYLTFQNYALAIGPPAEFVGLENYTEMVDNTRFWRPWLNTFLLIFPSMTVKLLLGLGIALLLNRIPRGKALITSLLIIPAMASPASAAMVWRRLFGVKYGGINNALM